MKNKSEKSRVSHLISDSSSRVADPERTIATLPEQVAALAKEEAEHFSALFSVIRSQGSLVPPPEMRAWIEGAFGSVEAVQSQAVIKTLNRWTLEGSLFNDLRARRPVERRTGNSATLLDGDGSDPFCNPLTSTPKDTFGRIRGAHSITASNVAKYDGLHSVVILETHNPLTWTEEQICDAFDTARKWIEAAHEDRPTAIYPFIMWNGLPRSGASQVHAHMQATVSEGFPYARLETWRRAAQSYRAAHGRNYFDDFYAAHASLGLAAETGTASEPMRRVAHLTPVKEKETILLARSLSEELYKAVHSTLRLFIDTLGVGAFNVAVYMPPLAPTSEDWSDFPVIVRMVDRGDPASSTSDIGAMELFAQPVVAFDPFRLARIMSAGTGRNEI